MHTKIQKFNAVLATGIITLSVGSLLVSTISAQAAFNTSASRYEDSLSTENKEAVYNYNYENTSADDAPGYFELSFEKLTGADVKDLIEVKSITEIAPIDYETKKAADDAKTTEYKISDAVYTDNGQLKIRISPQSECKVRPEGGCTDGIIPAAKPARISIKIALKDKAVTDPSLLFGTGRIYFPNGYDVNALGWKINANKADEAKVEVPKIEDKPIDTAILDANQAIKQDIAPKTESTPVTSNQNPALNAAQPVAPTVASNITSLATDSGNMSEVNSNKASSANQNIVLIAVGIIGALILAGLAIFFVNKNQKTKK